MIKNTIRRSAFALKTVFKFAPFISILYFLMAILSAVFVTVKIKVLVILIDNVSLYIKGAGSLKTVVIVGIFYIGAYLGTNMYTFFLSRMGSKLSNSLTKTLTPSILDKFSKIEYQYYENEKFKDILKRMGQNPQQSIHNTFFSVIQTINNILKYIGTLVAFFSESYVVGIISILIGIPVAFLEFRVTDKKEKLLREATKENRVDDYLQGLIINKEYAYENSVFESNDYIINLINNNRNIIYKQRKMIATKGFISSLVVFFLKLVYISLNIGILTVLFIDGNITLGAYVSIITAIGSLLSILNSMAYTISTLGSRTWAITYYKDFINFNEEIKESTIENFDNFEVEFDNVSFSYPESKAEVLHDISFRINSKEVVALVGANGAGKSTIIKLICGLYKPTKGHIYIDSKEVSTLSDETMSKLFSVVFQDFNCYQFTLRENVVLGNIDIIKNDQDIITALNQIELKDIITKGLDINLGTIESDAINVSLGQWQKIVLARTFLSKSKYAILDEPTSSLDPIAESKLYDNFLNILNNKGALIISHRLASAQFAKKIIVLANGRIVEMGSHEQLMEENGLYARMYTEQSSWYINRGTEAKR